MAAVVICEAYGWTLDQYLDQDLDFIYMIKERMKIDAQRAEKESSR